MLLEKCWAKINGGYRNYIGGNPIEVFSVCTNFGSQYLMHNATDLEIFWGKLKNFTKLNYLMACSSNNTNAVKDLEIIPGHAFTLEECVEARISGNNVRLLKIRNPRGRGEWNGAWSDGSQAWTKEAKKAFDFNGPSQR